MRKFSTRLVAFLVLTCMIIDPAYAAAFSANNSSVQRGEANDAFTNQALTPLLVGAFRRPLHAAAAKLAWLVPRWRPAEGFLDYERVERIPSRAPLQMATRNPRGGKGTPPVHPTVARRLDHQTQAFREDFQANRDILRKHTKTGSRSSKNAVLHFVQSTYTPEMIALAQDLVAYELTAAHIIPRVGDRIVFDHMLVNQGDEQGAFARSIAPRHVLIAIHPAYVSTLARVEAPLVSEIAHASDFLAMDILDHGYYGPPGCYSKSTQRKIVEASDYLRHAFYGSAIPREVSPDTRLLAAIVGETALPDAVHNQARNVYAGLFEASRRGIQDPTLRERMASLVITLNNLAGARDTLDELNPAKVMGAMVRALMTVRELSPDTSAENWIQIRKQIVTALTTYLDVYEAELETRAQRIGIYGAKLEEDEIKSAAYTAVLNGRSFVRRLAKLDSPTVVREIFHQTSTGPKLPDFMESTAIRRRFAGEIINYEVKLIKGPSDVLDGITLVLALLMPALDLSDARARGMVEAIQKEVIEVRKLLAAPSDGFNTIHVDPVLERAAELLSQDELLVHLAPQAHRVQNGKRHSISLSVGDPSSYDRSLIFSVERYPLADGQINYMVRLSGMGVMALGTRTPKELPKLVARVLSIAKEKYVPALSTIVLPGMYPQGAVDRVGEYSAQLLGTGNDIHRKILRSYFSGDISFPNTAHFFSSRQVDPSDVMKLFVLGKFVLDHQLIPERAMPAFWNDLKTFHNVDDLVNEISSADVTAVARSQAGLTTTAALRFIRDVRLQYLSVQKKSLHMTWWENGVRQFLGLFSAHPKESVVDAIIPWTEPGMLVGVQGVLRFLGIDSLMPTVAVILLGGTSFGAAHTRQSNRFKVFAAAWGMGVMLFAHSGVVDSWSAVVIAGAAQFLMNLILARLPKRDMNAQAPKALSYYARSA